MEAPRGCAAAGSGIGPPYGTETGGGSRARNRFRLGAAERARLPVRGICAAAGLGFASLPFLAGLPGGSCRTPAPRRVQWAIMKSPSPLPSARRFLSLALAFLLLVPAAQATWSIVVVNRATGEVCVASATCITNFSLKRWLPVVVVGKGGGAAQSAVDIDGTNRLKIRDGLLAGDTPQEILDLLAQHGAHQSRQYGIAAFDGAPVTFTGTGAGEAKYGVAGEVGDLAYAIQGNVLAGDAVILEAEQTFLSTPGDLGQRVMAAMETARLFGGDGRCSCSQSSPDGCGSPPPSFTKTAHTAFIVLARMGDEDGGCDTADGCASGKYYLSRQFNGGANDPDPVIVLQQKYDEWRQDLSGVPDHVLSVVSVDRDQLVADGRSSAKVRVRLVDVDGVPLPQGGVKLRIVPVEPGPPTAVPGVVTDHGDGSYTFDLVATDHPGQGTWHVYAQYKPKQQALLWPPLSMETDVLSELHAGYDEYSVSSGTWVPFTINRGPADAGRVYRILGSASGTVPGFDLGTLHVPLNPDRFFGFTWKTPGPPYFPGSAGPLDVNGRGKAYLSLPPAAWNVLVGSRLDFTALLGGPTLEVTEVVGFEVLP